MPEASMRMPRASKSGTKGKTMYTTTGNLVKVFNEVGSLMSQIAQADLRKALSSKASFMIVDDDRHKQVGTVTLSRADWSILTTKQEFLESADQQSNKSFLMIFYERD